MTAMVNQLGTVFKSPQGLETLKLHIISWIVSYPSVPSAKHSVNSNLNYYKFLNTILLCCLKQMFT